MEDHAKPQGPKKPETELDRLARSAASSMGNAFFIAIALAIIATIALVVTKLHLYKTV
jgi:hypothetical protein